MSSISAGTATGTAIVVTGDTTGALVFKTGASSTTAMTIGADQSVAFTGAVTGTSAVPTIVSFTTSGSWTAPANIRKIKVYITGGGAGGVSTSNDKRGVGGGGAGGTAVKVFAVTPGASYSYVVGTGGIADTSGNNSTFTVDTVTVTGAAGAVSASTYIGGLGGTATNGDLNIIGGDGGSGTYVAAATAADGAGGSGGASYWGSGGAGGAGTAGSDGVAGRTYGSGGGGASGGTVAKVGGIGASGVIVIEY